MKTLGNVLWFIFGGVWLALGYAVAGVVMVCLVVTIPFGLASWRLATYALWPFGRTVVQNPKAGTASTLGNILWFLLAGLWLAIGHVVSGVLLCLTSIGIPFGIVSFRLAGLALSPLGKQIVRSGQVLPAGTHLVVRA
ncbi:YccF domain-containing protein [Jatrophihabitans sp.]|uniref:YccF domain-containing protein n=1 Tax=Jatrophihabitans sp. TaxID=1932789 RepID=UPI0030C67AEB|nr:putative rane protein [Jatrophihabitans sp.]